MKLNRTELKELLDVAYYKYNKTTFIESDPISIPHHYTRKEDIEISAFLTATISWGQRVTIIKSAKLLNELMSNAPYEFITSDFENHLTQFNTFKHRTFQYTDLNFFLRSLKNIYLHYGGLEAIFSQNFQSTYEALIHFNRIFLEVDHQQRSEKHIANPLKGSAAKRLNMFLRWMVRNDGKGVDFGIWKKFPSAELMIPLDVHTGNVARKLGLLKRKQNDWKAVEELTAELRKMDENDPIKYDFALFGLGVFEGF